MDVRTGISLKQFTTMGLGGDARFIAEATKPNEIVSTYNIAAMRDVPVFVVGGGSNIIARDEGYNGIVLLNRIKGFEIMTKEKDSELIKIGAGEVWDEVVQRTVDMGLSGIEAMSGIPGTAGAAPVQNIGAYGQEVADTLVSLEAYDSETDQVVTMKAKDCKFSYRHSIFRVSAFGRYCILSITLRLYYAAPQPPFYAALQKYLDHYRVTTYTPKIIRQAVLNIRADKLPNPDQLPNSGSFFKNAIIEEWHYKELLKDYPTMPAYDMPGGQKKIPTGWLIERVGLKGKLLHGMRVYDKNALVLVNESARGYKDLSAARNQIIQTVYDTFRIRIEQEPLELV